MYNNHFSLPDTPFLYPDSILKRPLWYEVGNCFDGRAHTETELAYFKKIYFSTRQTLEQSRKKTNNWGLIRVDLHFANINIDPAENRIVIFDFDDCSYGWYMMDVALPILDILIILEEIDNPEFYCMFTDNLIEGYLTEKPDTRCLRQIPLILKLLEISLFMKLYKYYDPENKRSWEKIFMRSRKKRIQNDLPVIDYNFHRG